MKRFAKSIWMVSGVLLLVGSVAMNPTRIVHHFIPASMTRYQPGLIAGLQLTRKCLFLDGILCLLAPLFGRWFQPSPNAKKLVIHSDPVSRSEWAFVGAVTLLAASLRLYHLGVGFSYDEIVISMSMMEKSIPYLLARAEVWRTLYALCGHVLYALFGRSEFVAHLPSFFCGTASIPLLYFLVRDSLGKREAFGSALLLAVSGFHVWYSQIATSYSMSLFFSLVSMLLLPRCLTKQSFGAWLSWGTAVFLAVYSHFFVAAFAILGEAAYLIYLLYEERIAALAAKQFFTTLAYCGALFLTLATPNLPLYMNILSGLAGSQNNEFVDSEPRGTVIGQLRLFGAWLFQPYAPSWLQWYGMAMAAIGVVILWKRSKSLTVYLCLPTIILWAVFAAGIMRRITPRHSIFTLIPMCILLSVCATAAAGKALGARKPLRTAALALLFASPLLAAALISLSAYYHKERSAFRPTSVFLHENVPSDQPVYIGGFGYDAFHYYFPAVQKIETYDQLGELLKNPKPFWLIVYTDSFLQAMPTAMQSSLHAHETLRFDYAAFPEQYADPYESLVWHVNSPPLPASANAN